MFTGFFPILMLRILPRNCPLLLKHDHISSAVVFFLDYIGRSYEKNFNFLQTFQIISKFILFSALGFFLYFWKCYFEVVNIIFYWTHFITNRGIKISGIRIRVSSIRWFVFLMKEILCWSCTHQVWHESFFFLRYSFYGMFLF